MSHNLFQDIPAALPQEWFETLAASDDVIIERIVSRGQCSPPDFWYDQDLHEFVVLLQGQARLQLQGHEALVELRPGDYINLPAHTRHRVAWTTPDSDTVWLAIHF